MTQLLGVEVKEINAIIDSLYPVKNVFAMPRNIVFNTQKVLRNLIGVVFTSIEIYQLEGQSSRSSVLQITEVYWNFG